MTQTFSLETDSETVRISLTEEAARELEPVLPLNSRVSTWGDEIYFAVPIELTSGETTMDLHVGDVAFWPEGRALCLFFGPTPLSEGDEPRPADDVVRIGTIESDPSNLRTIEAGESVTLRTS